MRHYTLFYTCLIDASIKEVCAFHTDTNNLSLITPPSIGVKLVSKKENIILLNIKKFGITTQWKIAIETNCPHSIVDVMLKGPFAFFRHERHFSVEGDTLTRMDETISLALPIAFFQSFLFTFVKKDMDALFLYRHRMTQAHFKSLSEGP